MTDWRNLPPITEAEQPDFPEDFVPSQTFLRHMDDCDHAAMLYRRYRGGPGSKELNRGGLMHETIDNIIRVCAEEEEDSMPPDLGKAILTEVMDAHPEALVPAEERDALRYLIDHFCRAYEAPPPGSILGVEKTLTLRTGGFRVLIRPDLIVDRGGGLCEIHDWKSAWPPDSESFKAQAFDHQGRPRWAGNYQLNMAAVVIAYGVTDDDMPLGRFERYRLRLAFPRILRSDGTLDERVVEVDALQLAAFREDLDRQLRRLAEVCIAERRWQPTPGTHCSECPAPNACPLPRFLRPESQFGALDSAGKLEGAAASWLFHQREGATLKRRVKKAAEELDLDVVRIGGGDEELAFTVTPKVEVRDREAMFAEAEEASRSGRPFDREPFIKRTESVEFKKRKRKP